MKWIDYDKLTPSEEGLLKQLADELANPPNLTDYSKYWSDGRPVILKGDNNEEDNSTTEESVAQSSHTRREPCDTGQRSGSNGPKEKS